jgi:hypothetical protein
MTQRHFTASQSSSSPHLVRRRPTLEHLESRCLLAALTMFDEEQFVIELINRARANPAAEATRLGIDLNEGLPPGTLSASPKPPLAPHQSLIDAAAGHSQDMIDRNFFDHRNPDGDGPGERIADAGYLAARAWAENIAIHVGAADAHDALFRSPGHRLNMLGNTYREVGIGVRERNDWGVNMTETFAYRTGRAFLTGVAFSDQVVADSFFTAGEGLVSVTITATARTSGASYTTNTGPTGGYSLQVPSDTYDLTAAGGELTKPIAITGIGLGTANVKIDFVVPHLAPGPPIANDDRTMTERGAAVAIDVLANDSGAIPLPPATVAIVSQPSGGHVSIDGTTGRVAYTPAAGWTGPDEFTYRFQDSSGDWSPVARVIVAVVDLESCPWQNPLLAPDVNADQKVAALDALLLITHLNAYQDRDLPPPSVQADFPPTYWDVTGDGRVDAHDVLGIINYINYLDPVVAAEGEASGGAGGIQAVPVPTASPSRGNTADDALGASAGPAADLNSQRWPAATPDDRLDLSRLSDRRRRSASEDFDKRALVVDDVLASCDLLASDALLQAINAIAWR